ncbi:hypothetical protein OHU74_26690 [Streptomyces sp. NBC_00454]
MPEGDSVYRTAALLREALAGKVLIHSDFRVPRFATADLTGRTTLEVASRGKHLLIRLSGPGEPSGVDAPDTPGGPNQPHGPHGPGGPGSPSDPGGSDSPGGPNQTDGPGGPGSPGEPDGPNSLGSPHGPGGPAGSGGPDGCGEPGSPNQTDGPGSPDALSRPAPAGNPPRTPRRPPDRLTLHTHLRMDGAWRIFANAANATHSTGTGTGTGAGPAIPGGHRYPAHEIRVVLATATHIAVGYRLPVVELLRTVDEHRVVGHLGPDLLGPDWDAEVAAANLLADPGRPLGEALLDQRNLAGIGNIYKAELCFLAGLTPWTPVGDVPRATLPRLTAAAHRLLDANKGTNKGTNKDADNHADKTPRRNTTGSRRPGQDLFVYGRAHRPCLRCGTPVREAPQDGRPTYWCPRCQSGPTP